MKLTLHVATVLVAKSCPTLLQPHEMSMARLLCPWDFSGKNAAAVLCLVAQSCPTLRSHGLQPARFLCPWGFSRQEYWSGLPFPPPGDFPNPGIQPRSPTLQADSLLSEPPGKHYLGYITKFEIKMGIFNSTYLVTYL